MSPDETTRPSGGHTWLVIAGVLQALAMLLVMIGLMRDTPLTMTLSVGLAGGLLAAAAGLYVLTVFLDLRHRRVL